MVGTSIRQDDSILRTIIPLQDLPCTGWEEMGNPTEVVLRSKVLIHLELLHEVVTARDRDAQDRRPRDMIVADLESDVIAIRGMLFVLYIHQLQQLQVFCCQRVGLPIEVGGLEGHEGKEVSELDGILITTPSKVFDLQLTQHLSRLLLDRLYDHTRSDAIVRRLRHRGDRFCWRYRRRRASRIRRGLRSPWRLGYYRRRLGSGLGHILLTARSKTKRKKHREKEYLLCHTQIKNQMGRHINDDRVTKLALHHPIS